MPSNATHACIPCRYSAKQTYTCPYCQRPMTYMGKAFKPPKRSNTSQWAKVALLVEHDVRFGYCKCHPLRKRQIRTVAEAKNFIGKKKSAKKDYAATPDPRAEQIRKRKEWIADR